MQAIDHVLFGAMVKPAWSTPDSAIIALLLQNNIDLNQKNSLQIIKRVENSQELLDDIHGQALSGVYYSSQKELWIWSDVKITPEISDRNIIKFSSRLPQLSFSELRLLTRLCNISKVDRDKYDGSADELSLLSQWAKDKRISAQERQQLIAMTTSRIDSDKILQRTAQGLFDCDLSVTKAAQHLGVHRNTLTYRLNRIKKITNIDLTDFHQAKGYYQCWLMKKIEFGDC